MIEARSCERFKVLSENINDPELSEFYHELMISEATHYTMFINLAKKHAVAIDVDKRWKEFLAFEAQVVKNYGKAKPSTVNALCQTPICVSTAIASCK
jgi:tRNA-(ms[2]io[6]A)-hydroxylase